jgi:hypothetical protein
LYYGSGSGFWNNTVLSLSELVFGRMKVFFAFYFVAIVALSLFVCFSSFRKKLTGVISNSPGIIFLVLIIGNVAAAFILHILFNVNYQEDRTAIYYLSLLFGLMGFVIDSLVQQKGKWVLLLLIPIFFLPIFSYGKISLFESSYDRMPYVPKSFFEKVSASVKSGEFPPIVAGIHKRKQVWAWYNYLSGGKLTPVLFNYKPVLSADYLIYDFNNKKKPDRLYSEILFDKNSGLSLMKRKSPVKKSVLQEKVISNTPLVFADEYLYLLETSIDTVSCDGFLVELDFEIESNANPFEGVIVCELRDSTGTKIQFEALDLYQLQPEWKKGANKIHHSLLLSPLAENPSLLLIYIWNNRKVDFQILKGKTVVYKLHDH